MVSSLHAGQSRGGWLPKAIHAGQRQPGVVRTYPKHVLHLTSPPCRAGAVILIRARSERELCTRGQPDGGIFSIEVPSSQMTLACVDPAENSTQHSTCFLLSCSLISSTAIARLSSCTRSCTHSGQALSKRNQQLCRSQGTDLPPLCYFFVRLTCEYSFFSIAQCLPPPAFLFQVRLWLLNHCGSF